MKRAIAKLRAHLCRQPKPRNQTHTSEDWLQALSRAHNPDRYERIAEAKRSSLDPLI